MIDIIEDCEMVCRIDVYGRKAPLKLHIQYESLTQQNGKKGDKSLALKKQQTSLGLSPSKLDSGTFSLTQPKLPDLKVLVSHSSKAPDESNSFHVFNNPGPRVIIKKPADFEPEVPSKKGGNPKDTILSQRGHSKKKSQRDLEDCFLCKSIYITFRSSQGCTLGLQCSLPNQGEENRKRNIGENGYPANHISQDELKRMMRERVNEKMDKVFGAEDEYFQEIALKRKKVRQMAGLNNIDTNFVNKNVELIQDLAYTRNKQSLNRQLLQYRIEEAQHKAKYLEDMKIQKV